MALDEPEPEITRDGQFVSSQEFRKEQQKWNINFKVLRSQQFNKGSLANFDGSHYNKFREVNDKYNPCTIPSTFNFNSWPLIFKHHHKEPLPHLPCHHPGRNHGLAHRHCP